MKVQFNRQALAEALGLLTSVVPTRTPKPILHCVRISTDEDGVHIFATDLEIGLNCILSEVKVEQTGEAVINADKLAAIVRESVDEVLTLTHEEGACEIIGADSHFTIYSQDPEQFPNIPSFSGQPDIEVSLKALQEGTKQCLFATAKESSRYAINGVLWEIKAKKMSLVATDGRRLARSRVSLKVAPTDEIAQQKLIVPAKTMQLLEKLGSDQDDTLAVKLLGSQIVIQAESAIITSNLVEGSFPKYEDIIPTDNDKRFTLPTDTVLSAVRRASLLASEESKGIKLSICGNELMFSGRAPEAGAAEIKMTIDYEGDDISIGFNPQFLSDALRVIKSDTFELNLGTQDRPGLIKCGNDFLYVLMPINLA